MISKVEMPWQLITPLITPISIWQENKPSVSVTGCRSRLGSTNVPLLWRDMLSAIVVSWMVSYAFAARYRYSVEAFRCHRRSRLSKNDSETAVDGGSPDRPLLRSSRWRHADRGKCQLHTPTGSGRLRQIR